MIDKSRAMQLLGSGLSPEIVGTTLGCASEYIHQLLAEDDFRQRVTALRIEALTADTARDKNIDEIEDSLIAKLKENIDYLVSTKDILRAFVFVNAAKRRGVKATDGTVINNTVVNLMLPPAIIQKFATNRLGEVIEVEGKSLVTVSPQELLAKRKQKQSQNEDERKLPALAGSSS
jgi:hypothetical protein